jgi:hypothetical protein
MKTTINGTEFLFDEFAGCWGWSTDTTESESFFETAADAQQDAMEYVREQIAEERDQRQQDADERRFGTERQQVEAEWKAGRL